MKKIILITMGDPNGVGPEICAKAFYRNRFSKDVLPVIVGDPRVMQKAIELCGKSTQVQEISNLSAAHSAKGLRVWTGGVQFDSEIKPGRVSKQAGIAALGYIFAAVKAIQNKEAVAMVTAPVCKESIEKSHPGFQGHTEFIGELCGDPEPVLMLVHKKWVIAHVSTHVSLREAIDRVRPERIVKTGLLLNEFLKKVGIVQPRIGVAGLNPHAGENALFGTEEIDYIIPAVRTMRKHKVDAIGPLPADVVFPQLRSGIYDGCIAMYHDQGHVVTKTLAFHFGAKPKLEGVNVTLGLDLIRTSVDHGTGFDIAWSNQADCHSLLDAAQLAVVLSSAK
jgi:4-hydroxythreonine-4-phosphate dehydrogenase